MPDFRELLSTKVDEIERPKPLPVGTYTWLVEKQEFTKANNADKTDLCRFIMKALAADEDVSDEELAAHGENWNRRTHRADFWIDADSLYRLVDFCEKCGVDVSGRTLDELIPECVQTQVKGYLIQVPSTKDPDTIYNRFQGFLPA